MIGYVYDTFVNDKQSVLLQADILIIIKCTTVRARPPSACYLKQLRVRKSPPSVNWPAPLSSRSQRILVDGLPDILPPSTALCSCTHTIVRTSGSKRPSLTTVCNGDQS